jgi:hypothetical protein
MRTFARSWGATAALVMALAAIAPSAASARDDSTRRARHTVRTASRDVGHATRDAARKIGHGTRDLARDIGHAFRDLGRKLRD